jgi:hypothetical protein
VYAGAVAPQREPPDRRSREDTLPDVRDGLTRLERVILSELARAQRELQSEGDSGASDVSSALLYGRVVEQLNVSPREFQRALTRLVRRPP